MVRLIGSIAILAVLALPVLAVPALPQQQDTTMQQDTTKAPGRQAMPAEEDTTKAGEEMPTTASPLPLVIAAGSLLIVLGVGLRYIRNRS